MAFLTFPLFVDNFEVPIPINPKLCPLVPKLTLKVLILSIPLTPTIISAVVPIQLLLIMP